MQSVARASNNCDLQFGFRPSENGVISNAYVENFRKRMNSIHKNVPNDIQIVSVKMKEWYDVNAQAGEYQPGDLV